MDEKGASAPGVRNTSRQSGFFKTLATPTKIGEGFSSAKLEAPGFSPVK
jgi:hypothetical protein